MNHKFFKSKFFTSKLSHRTLLHSTFQSWEIVLFSNPTTQIWAILYPSFCHFHLLHVLFSSSIATLFFYSYSFPCTGTYIPGSEYYLQSLHNPKFLFSTLYFVWNMFFCILHFLYFFWGGVLIKYHSLEFELHERRICFLCFCVYDIWQCVYFVAALNTCF